MDHHYRIVLPPGPGLPRRPVLAAAGGCWRLPELITMVEATAAAEWNEALKSRSLRPSIPCFEDVSDMRVYRAI